MLKNLVKNVKMRFYEKAAKFEKKTHLGDFFQILWPSQHSMLRQN
jgi:hypothetical protein